MEKTLNEIFGVTGKKGGKLSFKERKMGRFPRCIGMERPSRRALWAWPCLLENFGSTPFASFPKSFLKRS